MAGVKHWFIPLARGCTDNQRMLDSKTLALRIKDAMDNAKPNRLTLGAVAEAFGISPQAVASWKKTGRIKKGHLLKLARLTGRPARYFLGDEADQELETQAFALAEDWLSLKNPMHRAHVRDLLDKYMALNEKFPQLEYTMSDEKVARHIAPAGAPSPSRKTVPHKEGR